jgi:hypothetical protein
LAGRIGRRRFYCVARSSHLDRTTRTCLKAAVGGPVGNAVCTTGPPGGEYAYTHGTVDMDTDTVFMANAQSMCLITSYYALHSSVLASYLIA